MDKGVSVVNSAFSSATAVVTKGLGEGTSNDPFTPEIPPLHFAEVWATFKKKKKLGILELCQWRKSYRHIAL